MIAGHTVVVLLISVNELCLWIQWGQAIVKSRLKSITSIMVQLEVKKHAQTCSHTRNGVACLKIDGYSTGQFSRGVKQEELLNDSLKDEDTTQRTESFVNQERKKNNQCYQKTPQSAQFTTNKEVCHHS